MASKRELQSLIGHLTHAAFGGYARTEANDRPHEDG